MKGCVVIIFLILAGLLGVFIYGKNYLESEARRGLEETLYEVTGATIKIEEFTLSPFSGKGFIDLLRVASPQGRGFDTPDAIAFKNVEIQLSVTSLFGETIEIDRIMPKKVVFFHEEVSGVSNLAALRGDMRTRYQAGLSPISSVKLRIKEFKPFLHEVREGMMSGAYDLKVPNPSQLDLGGESGALATELCYQILENLFEEYFKLRPDG